METTMLNVTKKKWSLTLLSAIAAAGMHLTPIAQGFMEDSLLNKEAKSSSHYDMVLAFGRCLGIRGSDAQTIANYSQATDSVRFNGISTDFTGRTSPNGVYFHVPQSIRSVDALQEIKIWSDPSNLGSGYAPKDLPAVTEQVKSLAGTLEAFGVYLHSLGDKYSHLACTDADYEPHCGFPFPACASKVDLDFCHYKVAHDHEYGADPTLTQNAATGLAKIYSAMAVRYGKGDAVPANVQQLIQTFVNSPKAGDRVAIAGAACR